MTKKVKWKCPICGAEVIGEKQIFAHKMMHTKPGTKQHLELYKTLNKKK